MSVITVDANKTFGQTKPLHAVNNGPVYKFTADQRISNLDAFKEAGIPYARTHDSSFFATYGGEHTIDIIAIFPDFSKDPYDPESYDFTLTDEYLKVIDYAGIETFYRLGSKIEHWPKKYGTVVPPDFHKWAVICEHIIRHYTEGWAGGFNYKITYWEIWNEPDLTKDTTPYVDRKTWTGTVAQFYEFFDTAAKHLKSCFPSLKIGGPATASVTSAWFDNFLAYCRDHKTPLDFLSWHRYAYTPETIKELIYIAREKLDANGYKDSESILNEWNYVKGWFADEWLNSLRTEKNLKGSSFITGCMAISAYAPVDMLMYYDARPCAMNGLFCTDFVCDKLKGYYPFWMFNRLYRLGITIGFDCENRYIYGCAAKSDNKIAVMLTNYNDDEDSGCENLALRIEGLDRGFKYTVYTLDGTKDCEITEEGESSGEISLEMPLFTTKLIEIDY